MGANAILKLKTDTILRVELASIVVNEFIYQSALKMPFLHGFVYTIHTLGG